jgi:transposase InsO family protein
VQYTSEAFTRILKDHQIEISMNGKGRALDNIYVLYEILLYAKEWPENASKSSIPDQYFA